MHELSDVADEVIAVVRMNCLLIATTSWADHYCTVITAAHVATFRPYAELGARLHVAGRGPFAVGPAEGVDAEDITTTIHAAARRDARDVGGVGQV